MGTYSQWRSHADKGQVKRVTWVCGEQRILVEEVVDTIRALLAVDSFNYVSFHAGSTPDADIWAAANQYPLADGNRLVLIRDAGQITHWAPLHDWLTRTRQLGGVYLLFVAAESDFPRPPGKGNRTLAPHVDALKAPRGHLVRCATPAGDDAIAWVQRQSALDRAGAYHLLTRTGGNLATAAAVCAKLALFDGRPHISVIDVLCAEAPADSFVECLLLGDKPAALTAIDSIDASEYGKTISILDQRLDLMAVLWQALRTGNPVRDLPGQSTFLVRQFLPAAKHYDPRRCAHSRRALAALDDAYRSGARTGLLESLVALW